MAILYEAKYVYAQAHGPTDPMNKMILWLRVDDQGHARSVYGRRIDVEEGRGSITQKTYSTPNRGLAAMHCKVRANLRWGLELLSGDPLPDKQTPTPRPSVNLARKILRPSEWPKFALF